MSFIFRSFCFLHPLLLSSLSLLFHSFFLFRFPLTRVSVCEMAQCSSRWIRFMHQKRVIFLLRLIPNLYSKREEEREEKKKRERGERREEEEREEKEEERERREKRRSFVSILYSFGFLYLLLHTFCILLLSSSFFLSHNKMIIIVFVCVYTRRRFLSFFSSRLLFSFSSLPSHLKIHF